MDIADRPWGAEKGIDHHLLPDCTTLEWMPVQSREVDCTAENARTESRYLFPIGSNAMIRDARLSCVATSACSNHLRGEAINDLILDRRSLGRARRSGG